MCAANYCMCLDQITQISRWTHLLDSQELTTRSADTCRMLPSRASTPPNQNRQKPLSRTAMVSMPDNANHTAASIFSIKNTARKKARSTPFPIHCLSQPRSAAKAVGAQIGVTLVQVVRHGSRHHPTHQPPSSVTNRSQNEPRGVRQRRQLPSLPAATRRRCSRRERGGASCVPL